MCRGGVQKGSLRLTRVALQFEADPPAAGTAAAAVEESPEVHASQLWGVGELRQMQRRRYLLVHCAVELFVGASAVFFNLHTKKRAQLVRRALRRVGVPERTWKGARAALLDAWHRREISNFEYLMELNTLAGRTFNDLNQYPVFPWVLADYASEKLDLGDAAIYRDLSKPVGALSPERLARQVVERYAEMDDTPELPRFHYGSHYSSAGATLFWLLRLEPFTTYAIELQSGRFDHADRLFHSVGEAWKSCNTSLADVKELIPEFFYCADFLQNGGRYDLGVRQDGERLGDVVLPPWARGSPTASSRRCGARSSRSTSRRTCTSGSTSSSATRSGARRRRSATTSSST